VKCPVCGKTVKSSELQRHLDRFHGEISFSTAKTNTSSKSKTKSKTISSNYNLIVDGNNVAYFLDRPLFSALKKMNLTLRKKGYTPLFIVSAALKYSINDYDGLMDWIKKGRVIEAPSGEDDDVTVLEYAKRYNCRIISNDRFLEYYDLFKAQVQRIIRYSFVGRSIIFTPTLKKL